MNEKSAAIISACERYRYSLNRVWGATLPMPVPYKPVQTPPQSEERAESSTEGQA